MFEGIPCSKCSSLLVIDEFKTTSLYKDGTYEVADVDTLVEKFINKTVCFVCSKCGNEEYINYKQWEERLRVFLTKKSLKERSFMLLTKFRSSGVEEDNGISYCGACFGYGGDGWCLNDIINQCELGKTK